MEPVAAVYNDGRTAAGHAVTIRIATGGLDIVDEAERVLDHWPSEEVRLIPPPAGGALPRLARSGSDARLTLAQASDLSVLAPHCQDLRDRAGRRWAAWRAVAGWGVLAVASVALLFLAIIPWGAKTLAFALPEDAHQAIGRETETEILRALAHAKGRDPASMVCGDEEGRAVLAAMAERLSLALSPRPVLTVSVVDHAMVNAFALPGGRILVMRGLLDFAADGDEVAGVLAHEIAHVHRRHPASVFLERASTGVLIGILMGDLTGGTLTVAAAQLLAGAAYGRKAEAEADEIGGRLMREAGWDAAALGRFLERVREKEGTLPKILGFLSTHPLPEDRAAAIGTNGPAPVPALGPGDWAALKRLCGQA